MAPSKLTIAAITMTVFAGCGGEIDTGSDPDLNAGEPTRGAMSVRGAPGGFDYCSSSHKCANRMGDCDRNDECLSGNCVKDIGSRYGYGRYVDVCLAAGENTSTPAGPSSGTGTRNSGSSGYRGGSPSSGSTGGCDPNRANSCGGIQQYCDRVTRTCKSCHSGWLNCDGLSLMSQVSCETYGTTCRRSHCDPNVQWSCSSTPGMREGVYCDATDGRCKPCPWMQRNRDGLGACEPL